MDMSLDEIIKVKKIAPVIVKKGVIFKKPLKTIGKISPRPVIDARNKIIQKNRAKIRDARDKLAEITRAGGDARLRLERKQHTLPVKLLKTQNFRARKLLPGKPPKFPPSRLPPKIQPVQIPRGYVDYDNMDRMEEEEEYASANLRRTVKNDIAPPFVPFPSSESHWMPDPFDVYSVPSRRADLDLDDISIRRQVRNMSPDMPPKGILRPSRHSSPPYPSRRYVDEHTHLSHEMRTRLEHAPDPHSSMGIFSNPLKNQQSSSSYRIVVSNLHTSVSQGDIKELFEDIGELFEARLVRPGVAEVIFKSLKDAEKAVDTYHNRQLDGQPMKCLLVNPRASNKPTAPAVKDNYNISSRGSASSGKTPLEIDIDALHKVLFRRH